MLQDGEWDGSLDLIDNLENCRICGRQVVRGGVCVTNRQVVYADGVEMETLKHKAETNCLACGVVPGSPHHPGCREERCPRCFGRLILCACIKSASNGNASRCLSRSPSMQAREAEPDYSKLYCRIWEQILDELTSGVRPEKILEDVIEPIRARLGKF